MLSRRIQAFLIVSAFFGAIALGVAMAFLRQDSVCRGVQVAGIDVGGMSLEEAETRLEIFAEEHADVQVVLRYADQASAATLAEIGGEVDAHGCAESAYMIGREGTPVRRLGSMFSAYRHGFDLPVLYSFNQDVMRARLAEIAREIERPPVDARLVVENNEIMRIPQRHGAKLEIDQCVERIVRMLNSGHYEVDLPVHQASPEIVTADFEGIDSVVSTFSTKFNPGERDRSHNLRVACAAVDGTLVKPGETFSFNEVVGPRTGAQGFRDAPMFVRGEIEMGTGGGVCQVSTTVYNAALLANMNIVRRAPHSRPVAYVPVGRDATVIYSVQDLKLANAGDAPVYIIATVEGSTVKVSILGKSLGDRSVRIVTSGHRTIPATVVREIDDSLEPGKEVVLKPGRSGHRVTVHRLIEIDGNAVSRELISNDYYRPENRVVAVPPEPS